MLADRPTAPPAAATSAAANGFKPPPPKPRGRSASPAAAAAAAPRQGAPAAAAVSPTGSGDDNALASLLGYDEDAGDSPRSSGGQPAAAASPQRGIAVQALAGEPGPAAAGASPAAAKPAGDSMDAQLHSFLSELESSGLLQEDGGGGEREPPQGAAAATPAAGASQGGPSTDGDSAGGAGAAEQQVLGPVEGAGSNWYLVLDTGSGRRYCWNQATNEVAWTPPAGATLLAGAAAASDGASAGAAPATAGTGAQQQRGAAAAAPSAALEAPAAAPDLGAAFLVAPTAAALEAAERIAEECTEAAGPLLDDVPKVRQQYHALPGACSSAPPCPGCLAGSSLIACLAGAALWPLPCLTSLPVLLLHCLARPAGGAVGRGGAGALCAAAAAGPGAAGGGRGW